MEEIKKNNKINCNFIYNKIFDTNDIYIKICKQQCITNSCKRRKEEVLGNLLDIYKSLETCKM